MSPLYAGAPGRVLLAFAPPEVLDEVLAQDLLRITDRTPTEAELRASLGGIVMTGLAISEGELIDGLRGDGRAGLPRGRDRRGDRGPRAGLPLRRGVADASQPAGSSRPRPGRSTRRWRRTGTSRLVLLSRICGRPSSHSVVIRAGCSLCCTDMSHRSPSPFDRLAPVSDRYATLPVADAFTWDACAAEVEPGEWYMVAFRSVRRAGVDEERLTAHDDWAHAEAMEAAGLRPLLQGPDPGRRPLHVVLPVGQPGRGTRRGRPAGPHARRRP